MALQKCLGLDLQFPHTEVSRAGPTVATHQNVYSRRLALFLRITTGPVKYLRNDVRDSLFALEFTAVHTRRTDSLFTTVDSSSDGNRCVGLVLRLPRRSPLGPM